MGSVKDPLDSPPVGKIVSSNQCPKAEFNEATATAKLPTTTPDKNEATEKVSANVSVIIFPGAWHPASCMSSFVSSLRSIGLPAEAYTLRSVGDASAGVADDVDYMRSIMNPLIDAGNDVVVVSHSYAGFPTTSAISGMAKRGREARGEKGGVLGVIYLASFVPQDDDSLYGVLGNQWPPWIKEDETEQFIVCSNEGHIFYKDCTSEQVEAVAKSLKPHSLKASKGKDAIPKNIGWRESGYHGRRGYIRLTEDNAIPLSYQDYLISRSGVNWSVKTLSASHSPFLSMPDATAKLVHELVQEFLAA
ncbi:hypothetical protein H634G_10761 [Metarhizium anisopliae BRIP 53293]|uniref:AB hydrolase-1 domain-containing protein n=1 Tax=Metarhizium anisopliae BRIP 53293 TaxID=1291518 RepID=A0A0D9NIQ3_METAN|nr:hypothetical protein H634G_10761 [Metarhizium anisopliae BRIP 53293]